MAVNLHAEYSHTHGLALPCRESSHSCGRDERETGLLEGRRAYSGFPLLRTNLIKNRLRSSDPGTASPQCPPSVWPRCAKAPAAWSSTCATTRRASATRPSPPSAGACSNSVSCPGEPFEVDRGDLARRRSDGRAPRQHDVRAATARGRRRAWSSPSTAEARHEQPDRDADPMRLALVGVPNCGKTALFNRLTGSRQKVANYAGVTVERKEGSFIGPAAAAPVPGARPARRLQPHADDARRGDHARLPARPAGGRAAAGIRRLRRRCDQPAAQPAAGARTARPRRADGRRAQHERPRARAAATSSIARGSSRNSACRSSRPSRCDHGGDARCWSTSSRRCRIRRRARSRRLARRRRFDEIQHTQREVRRILRGDRLPRAAAQAGARAPRCARHASGRRPA